ncbi:Cif family virulence factor [Pseudozobellia thermophila]|uniref:DUF4440 domain-containing protein n=1 Tax=Pseudozobellia thermophila TaxID=192903 RepID=A0A1M6P1S3_9FLAO|nr:hypothetical protein [Pseudozobellia thermophila]SHK01833.1 hypothetical protein SAMN04488513_11728 [Pseudozobellia thermophila]
MRHILLILIIVIGSHSGFSQNTSELESLKIASKIDDWNKAWEIKDAELACKWYSENADFTNAFGFNRIGKSEIQKYLTEVFGLDFVMAGNTEQTSIKFKKISNNAILVITTVERRGQKSSDNKDLGIRRTSHYRLFEKTNDWFIKAHLISDARSIKTEKH